MCNLWQGKNLLMFQQKYFNPMEVERDVKGLVDEFSFVNKSHKQDNWDGQVLTKSNMNVDFTVFDVGKQLGMHCQKL